MEKVKIHVCLCRYMFGPVIIHMCYRAPEQGNLQNILSDEWQSS
jgi:hypothetical protein